MKYLVYKIPCYAWTGRGKGEDAIFVEEGTKALILNEFLWQNFEMGDYPCEEPAGVILLPAGRVVWTPFFWGHHEIRDER